MNTELLQPGQSPAELGAGRPALGAAPQSAEGRNAGGQATHGENSDLPGGEQRDLGPSDVAVRSEKKGLPPMTGIPESIPIIQITEELLEKQFPNESLEERQAHLKRLQKKFPEGIPGVRGGADTGQDLLLQMMQAMQSEEALEVTELTARMHGVQLALAYRYGGQTGKGAELAADQLMMISGMQEITKLTRLATLQQIVTTSPVSAQYRGDGVLKKQDGSLVIATRGALSPPQLVREFRVNDPERGDSFAMAPLLPEKLEKFARAIQIQQLGAPRVYSPSELEATRRQTSAYFAMLNLQPGLAGSLSTHDMIALRAWKDRIMSGSHDEAPMMQVIGLVSQVHQALAADNIDAVANLYTTHLTETRIFHAMRTFGVAVGMQVLTASGEKVEVSGTVTMGDFMDQLLSSQGQLEHVMQSITDAGPRQAIRGLQSMDEKKPGVVMEEGDLIWRVLGQRLGRFDSSHQLVSLREILFEGRDPASMTRKEVGDLIEARVLRTNIPDVEVMMPLTQESLGGYPMDENVAGAMYPLYLSAREFSRALLLDMMMTPDFQGKAGKAVRKLKRWIYDVWTYWQGKTGLNELQKTFPYKDFVSERIIPKLIELIDVVEVPGWKETLRSTVERQGGVWLEAFDSYPSYTALAKDIIATTLTNPTLLASRAPQVEGYLTALALNTSSTTSGEKLSVYKKQLQKDLEKGIVSPEEIKRRSLEFEHFMNYWTNGGPLQGQYEADKQRKIVPQQFTLEDWLKYKIRNELYASRSQRPGTLKTKEEMLVAVDMLTLAEQVVLDAMVPAFRDTQGAHPARRAVNFEKIANDMGLTFARDEGYAGAQEFIKRFSWRNFPINAVPPRLVDGTSVGGYFTDVVALTEATAKFTAGLGSPQAESVSQFQVTGENVDVGQVFGLVKAAGEYLQSTFHFVPYAAQRERALEFWKVLLAATTQLKPDELIVATMRTSGGAGTTDPTHQEMFIPIGLFGSRERSWLKSVGMRGSKEGGREGMIFMEDFPARFRLQFGDVKKVFQDMRRAAEACKQPLTVVGMERPNYNTLPWQPIIDYFTSSPGGNELLYKDDIAKLVSFAHEHLSPEHRHVSETSAQRGTRLTMDTAELLKNLWDLLPK